jgi:hypothetical protein
MPNDPLTEFIKAACVPLDSGHASGTLERAEALLAAHPEVAARPSLDQVIAVVEQIKGERWSAFRDRDGDWGRDLVLYLGRKPCGLKLGELGAVAGGLDDAAASAAVQRFEQRLFRMPALAGQLRQAQASAERGSA